MHTLSHSNEYNQFNYILNASNPSGFKDFANTLVPILAVARDEASGWASNQFDKACQFYLFVARKRGALSTLFLSLRYLSSSVRIWELIALLSSYFWVQRNIERKNLIEAKGYELRCCRHFTH